MNKTQIIALQVVLLASGAYATKKLSKSMLDDGKLNPQPNVLHLKRSPFGRTLALAMRGPVDIYWHRGARTTTEATEMATTPITLTAPSVVPIATRST